MHKKLFLLLVSISSVRIGAFSIPKFYHAHIFNDETRFSERYMTSLDILITGGGNNFCYNGKSGRLDITELYVEFQQNFTHGFFAHLFFPVCWVKQKMVHRSGVIEPSEPCLHETNLYSPAFLAGWTINYENTHHLDFVDATLQAGLLVPSAKNTVRGPLFPISYSTKAGFAAHGALALGYVEWLTFGAFSQVLVYPPATVWSAGTYIKADHVIPRLSFTIGLCGDGQSHALPLIAPWQMLSLYGDIQLDLATDDRPYLPRLRAFVTGALAGKNIVKATLAGAQLGTDISWNW